MSGSVQKWRLYCETDNRCEFVWQTDAPTQCPTNAAHTVRANSVDIAATATKTKRINASNSPYAVKSQNFYMCDTSAGAISITLPSACGKNAERTLYFVKDGTDGDAVTVTAYGSETIDGVTTPYTLSSDKAFVKLTSNSTDGWLSVSALDTDGGVEDERVDERTAPASDSWVFRDTKSNAINGGTNVASAWTTRPFNVTLRDCGAEILRSGNDFIVSQGTYSFHAECSFYKTQFTRLRLRNVTDNTTAAVSLNAFLNADSTGSVVLDDTIVVPSSQSKTFRLEYYCSRVQATTGLGRANGTGDAEIYAFIRFVKED